MEKVFEPGELELADAQGDPNQAIETQQRIKELLGANRQRQQALKADILARGRGRCRGSSTPLMYG